MIVSYLANIMKTFTKHEVAEVTMPPKYNSVIFSITNEGGLSSTDMFNNPSQEQNYLIRIQVKTEPTLFYSDAVKLLKDIIKPLINYTDKYILLIKQLKPEVNYGPTEGQEELIGIDLSVKVFEDNRI